MLRLIGKYKIELNLFSPDITHTAQARPFLSEQSSLLIKLEEGIYFTISSLLGIFIFPNVYDLSSRYCHKSNPWQVGFARGPFASAAGLQWC